MTYFGHTADDEDGYHLPKQFWQILLDHLLGVAGRASQFARPMKMESEAGIAGLLHDLGKYAARFQQRLEDNSIHGINHWSIGAFQSWALGRTAAALAIEGHHTGIPALSLNNADLECWRERYQKLASAPDAAKVNGFSETLADLLERFAADKLTLPPAIFRENPAGREFATAMRVRFLFSCLVDADFLDTEQHFDPAQAPLRRTPPLQAAVALQSLRAHLDTKSSAGEVNQLRRRLLDDCLNAAAKASGLFTLTAPTGSGKTLASLAFALRHIEFHNAGLAADDPMRLRRIVVVIPYTSIIEQTAAVYRNIFEKKFGADYVLEHHSAVAPCEQNSSTDKDAEDARIRRARLASENWDAPLVVTTSVQFFESLFSNRPSQCRKLHNLARSVILFDEVQTLPREKVPSLLSAVRLLTQEPYGATAVFMTATQPAFGVAEKLIEGGWSPTEISSNPAAMAEAFKRVEIIRKPDDWRPTWPEVADILRLESQCLAVVNTKAAARALFEALPKDGNTFHLSTALCAAHRQAKLTEIRRRLDPKINEPCRLISTQLIEAGVDVDFPVVWRALGPLDSIIQTAGRCNREGKLPQPGIVTVFRPAEHAMPRGAYRQAAAVTVSFLAQQPDAPLHQPETYSAYFRQLYGVGGPQKTSDDKLFKACHDFDFPAAAIESRLIGDETRGVLVPWGEGEQLIAEIRAQYHCTVGLFRRCQRFTINLYLGEFAKAEREGIITPITPDKSVYAWTSKYDENLGASHHSADELVL
jgi:CRISPR-associated helicase Cas3/CRISPR-associated endonuclease Cas3-HD